MNDELSDRELANRRESWGGRWEPTLVDGRWEILKLNGGSQYSFFHRCKDGCWFVLKGKCRICEKPAPKRFLAFYAVLTKL